MRLSRRRRIQLVVLTIFCLLFQQVAVAAYVCTLDTAPAPGPRIADCHQPPADEPAAPLDALCAKHCAPDTATSAEARSMGVPLPALPPPLYLPVLLAGDASVGPHAAERPDARHPPPQLRYTRLLI